MRPIRKLYFQNAAGDRRGLNGESGAYATSLSGFGFSLDPDFSDLGRGFFPAVNTDNEPQNHLAFTIVLTRGAYEAHQALMDWLAAAGSLTMVYNPTGKREYCRDVSINFITKGELNQVGWLELPCSLFCLTPWYLPSPTSLSVAGTGQDESKRYSYRYGKSLSYGADSTGALKAIIAGAGHIPGALDLSFRGAIVNPQIRLTGNATGKTYGICKMDVTLESTDLLEFSTRYENSYARKIAADGTQTDLLDALDLSKTPFFHIPVDEPCTLLVESDAPIVGRVNLLIYYYYRSV